MNQIMFGTLSALSLGTADFLAGISGRAVGHAHALLAVFVVSCIGLTSYMLITDSPIVVNLSAQWLIVAFGIMNTVAMLLLYRALALGPVSVAAPIVAAHPVVVILIAFILGSRPSIGLICGMFVALSGAIIVARASISGDNKERGGKHTKTVIVATCASVAYAVMVMTGQYSVPEHGTLTTIWLGRIVALVVLVGVFMFSKKSAVIQRKWIPLLCVQGLLDFGGVLFLLNGSIGSFSEIAAVLSSLFGVVTVILARMFLKEKMSTLQWTGIAIVFTGVAVISASM